MTTTLQVSLFAKEKWFLCAPLKKYLETIKIRWGRWKCTSKFVCQKFRTITSYLTALLYNTILYLRSVPSNIFFLCLSDWNSSLKGMRAEMWLTERLMSHHHTLQFVFHSTQTFVQPCFSCMNQNSRSTWSRLHCLSAQVQITALDVKCLK